jgi:hypothetical protein
VVPKLALAIRIVIFSSWLSSANSCLGFRNKIKSLGYYYQVQNSCYVSELFFLAWLLSSAKTFLLLLPTMLRVCIIHEVVMNACMSD